MAPHRGSHSSCRDGGTGESGCARSRSFTLIKESRVPAGATSIASSMKNVRKPSRTPISLVAAANARSAATRRARSACGAPACEYSSAIAAIDTNRIATRYHRVETFRDVFDEIGRMFAAGRQTHERVGQTQARTLRRRNRRVRHARRMTHERFHAAETLTEREVLPARHERDHLVNRAFELARDDAAEARHLPARDVMS